MVRVARQRLLIGNLEPMPEGGDKGNDRAE